MAAVASDAAPPGGITERRPMVSRRAAAAAPALITQLLPRRLRRLDLLSIGDGFGSPPTVSFAAAVSAMEPKAFGGGTSM
jgi:hypothetical protein